MKYSIGDRVIIRSDLRDNVSYYMDDRSEWNAATEEMRARGGEVMTIHAIEYGQYLMEGMDYVYWTDEMFEGLEEDAVDEIDFSGVAANIERLF